MTLTNMPKFNRFKRFANSAHKARTRHKKMRVTIIYLPEESCKNLNLRKIAMKKGESTRQIFRLTSCRESPGTGGTLRSSSIGRRRPSPRWSSGAPPPRGPASPRRPTAPPRSGNRGRTTAGGPRNLCLKETGKGRLLIGYNSGCKDVS